MLEGAEWDGRLLRLNGVRFYVDHEERGHPAGTLVLLKGPGMLENMVKTLSELRPQRILELGTRQGGSAAFWFECFQPDKLVTLDLHAPTQPEFTAYREHVGDRLACHFGVDQADAPRLREIVASEFDGPLDLVIDDASHLYEPTRASFDALWPLLRPGGIYVIEDWGWKLSPRFAAPHPWADETGLVVLVEELVHRFHVDIACLHLRGAFAVVEKKAHVRARDATDSCV